MVSRGNLQPLLWIAACQTPGHRVHLVVAQTHVVERSESCCYVRVQLGVCLPKHIGVDLKLCLVLVGLPLLLPL
jgi:hypothetical protein